MGEQPDRGQPHHEGPCNWQVDQQRQVVADRSVLHRWSWRVPQRNFLARGTPQQLRQLYRASPSRPRTYNYFCLVVREKEIPMGVPWLCNGTWGRVRYPWWQPLWLSLLWRRHGRPPSRLRVPATSKWGPRNLDLWQQGHRRRLPPGKDDQVGSRQRRARGLCGDLPRWRVQLQALQDALHGQERPH